MKINQITESRDMCTVCGQTPCNCTHLMEFAPPSDGGDDGFSDDTLKRMAAQWYNGDEDPRVEKTLAAAGWEIGQDEGYDDEPGVFVVQAGDVNGNSYMSWPADELRSLGEGVAEGDYTHLYVNPDQGSPIRKAYLAINRYIDERLFAQYQPFKELDNNTQGQVYDLLTQAKDGFLHGNTKMAFKALYSANTLCDDIDDDVYAFIKHATGVDAYSLDKAEKGVAEGTGQDSKAWMASIKQQYPNVRFVQAKMPGSPIIALVDGKKVAEFGVKSTSEAWDPVTHGDFPVDYDADDVQTAIGADNPEKWRAMTQYYMNHITVTKALDELYRALGKNFYGPTTKPIQFVAKMSYASGLPGREKTETKYFKSKQDVYRYAQTYNREVLSIQKVDNKDEDSDLVKLPVMLGIGDHKKKWILPFPDENYAQKWQFKHKNIAQILWPAGHGLAEAVTLDRSKNPNYPNDPKTQKHHLDTAKSLLSDPKTDPDSRREAAAIVARLEKSGVAEGNKKPEPPEADYGPAYQDMVSRVKKLAGLGPLKTVYDPKKRVYKNVPTAVQPKKEQR